MAEEFIVMIVEPDWEPANVTEEQWAESMKSHGAFAQAVAAAGAQILGGDALQPSRTAVRITPGKDGKPVFTDGPFSETKEVVSGYYKLGVRDAAQARELAALCPTSGWVELYPVLQIEGM
ncbi:MAG: hypothetical protein JWP19_629 [Rhodoglobus sp.]|nr:hypothetical protein [Rhodoglobus sp.]